MIASTIEANGLAQHVLEWPGAVDRTVVLLHGYLDQGSSFVPVGERLAQAGYRVIAPDFRGHGRSAWAPPGCYYHFPDYVADLSALVDVLVPATRARTFSLVAHSMGGTVATLYAGIFSDRVRALVLAEGVGPPAMPASAAPDRMRRWLDALPRARDRAPRRLQSLDEAVERLSATHGGSVPRDVLERIAAEVTAVDPSGEGLRWRFDPLHQTPSPSRFDEEAFEQFVQRVTAPVLLVDAGSSGWAYPNVHVRKALYANSRSATLEGAGHMMHWTQPREFAELVLGFLDSVVSAPPM